MNEVIEIEGKYAETVFTLFAGSLETPLTTLHILLQRGQSREDFGQ